MSLDFNTNGYTGQMLVAMPSLGDPTFRGSVVMVCAHSPDGAMGLIINRLAPSRAIGHGVQPPSSVIDALARRVPIRTGGPAEISRPFVLHSPDWIDGDDTLLVDGHHAMTATPNVLAAVAAGNGPGRTLVALGYSGWGPGQLDAEVMANVWLTVPSSPRITFMDDIGDMWGAAASQVGAAPAGLSGLVGHA